MRPRDAPRPAGWWRCVGAVGGSRSTACGRTLAGRLAGLEEVEETPGGEELTAVVAFDAVSTAFRHLAWEH
jgi:hypothetical protein